MPRIDLTDEERSVVLTALDTEMKSAKRAQNSGKTPQIREVYATQERMLQGIAAKIGASK